MIPQRTRKPFCLIKIAYTGAYLEHDFLLLFGMVKTWWFNFAAMKTVCCDYAHQYRSDSTGRAGKLTFFIQDRKGMICIAYIQINWFWILLLSRDVGRALSAWTVSRDVDEEVAHSKSTSPGCQNAMENKNSYPVCFLINFHIKVGWTETTSN